MKTGSMVIGCMLTPLTKTFNNTPTPTLSGNVTGNVAYQAAATATTPMVATTCCGVGAQSSVAEPRRHCGGTKR